MKIDRHSRTSFVASQDAIVKLDQGDILHHAKTRRFMRLCRFRDPHRICHSKRLGRRNPRRRQHPAFREAQPMFCNKPTIVHQLRSAGWTRWVCFTACLLIGLFSNHQTWSQSTTVSSAASAAAAPTLPPEVSHPKAVMLLNQTIDRLANGPAFNAKVRQRVWAVGQEVRGIGTYEQAGYGSGRFNLQIGMFDGTGKHSLQQISDGRLAWTRAVIADEVSLRRVDVGRLDEWIPAQARHDGNAQGGRSRQPVGLQPVDFSAVPPISADPTASESAASPSASSSTPLGVDRVPKVAPRLIVGAWTEMLDTLNRNHVLRLGSSQIESQPVLVIVGTLRERVREEVLSTADGVWPEMYPTTVKVAISTAPNPETGFGEGLPIRFEFWCDPDGGTSGPVPASSTSGSGKPPRLVTLIEMYAIHPMTAPPVERFRFENQDAEVNFVNETDQYLRRYGVRITDNQRRLLMR